MSEHECSVVKKLLEYIDDRIDQTSTMLRKNHIPDELLHRTYTTRYLELEDIRAKLNELIADTETDICEDGWISCEDCQPSRSGIYVCTCRYTDDADDTRFVKLYRRYLTSIGEMKWEPEFDKRREVEILAWKDWEDTKPYGKPLL